MLPIRNLGDILSLAPDTERTAFVDLSRPGAPRSWTYRALRDACSATATRLRASGIGAGHRVAILADNRAEFVIAYLAIMQAGAAAVPINHHLPKEALRFIFDDADLRLAFADAPRIALCPESATIIELDELRFATAQTGREPEASVDPDADGIAKILYTSGSTGRPKGVLLTHFSQLWALGNFRRSDCAPPEERSLVVAPAYHKNGLFRTMTNLVNAETIVSLPRFEPRPYLQAIHDWSCTMLTGIPTMFALIARETDLIGRLDLSSVTMIAVGSAPLTAALLARMQNIFPDAVILNGYGTTEAGPAVFGPHPAGRPRPAISLGHPLPDVEWRLVGGARQDEGVLHLRSPAGMAGYLNLPEQTATKLRDGWYDTGDIMRRDGDGFFYFVGRADDMLVCGGENVYPAEVEQLLERHPGVAEAVVVAAPDEIKGEIPVAFVVRKTGSAVTEQELRDHSLQQGAAFRHPRFVIFKDQIPVTGTHKVDRQALVAEASAVAAARRCR